MEEGKPPAQAEDGIMLIEGWMLGRLLFPLAIEEVLRNPPANDPDGD